MHRDLKMLRSLKLIGFLICVGISHAFAETNSFPAYGPAFHVFPLTLSSGHRTEAMGPMFVSELSDEQHTLIIPPLFSHTRDEGVDSEEMDILYPFISYDRYGKESRFHIIQVFSFAGGQDQEEKVDKRFTLFPFYFQQRSPKPENNYTALFPFYGTIKGRLFRDYIHVVMFPLYSETHKKDWTTYNYLYPVFHRRTGPASHGWQAWPLIGHDYHAPVTQTNMYTDEKEVIGGHDRWFGPWPIFFHEHNYTGTTNEEAQLTILPFYNRIRSLNRDITSYGFPLGVTVIEDREKKYHELGTPWPIIDFAHGSKTITRIWPLYSRAKSAKQESDFYLWPFYKYNRFTADVLDYRRTRIMFYLYSDRREKNLQTGITKTRKDFWPLFTATKDFDGNTRLQVLSVLEPILPNSKSIARNYSQLWSVWRQEHNGKTGATSQSLLWNLYRHDANAERQNTSVFFGMFQREREGDKTKWRIFYIPFGKRG